MKHSCFDAIITIWWLSDQQMVCQFKVWNPPLIWKCSAHIIFSEFNDFWNKIGPYVYLQLMILLKMSSAFLNKSASYTC